MNARLPFGCFVVLTIFFAIEIGAPIEAGAHGGGLNRQGCHNERRTGGYHCHRSSYTPPPPRVRNLPRRTPQPRVVPRASTTTAPTPSSSLRIKPSALLGGTSIQPLTAPMAAPTISPSRVGPAAEVLEVQRYLVYLGFDIGPIDGLMGVRTQAAIQSYQRTRSLKPDGRVSESLLNHMATAIGQPTTNKPIIKPPSKSEALFEQQKKLIERTQFYLGVAGLYEGKNDGTVTVELEQAIMRFQNANQVSVDGRVSRDLINLLKMKVYQ